MTRQLRALVADLRGSTRERQLYAWLCRIMSVASPQQMLLANAPGGALGGLDRLRRLRVVQPGHLVDPAAQEIVSHWVLSAVRNLLGDSGRALFASHEGVHLGELNRLQLEIDYLAIGTLNAAMHRAEEELNARTRWTLFGYDRDLLFAAGAEARKRGHDARVFPPRGVESIRDTWTRSRGDAVSRRIDHIWDVPRADVLMLSWTRPMDEMFSAVEEQLPRFAKGASLRVHFGNDTADRSEVTNPAVFRAPEPNAFGRLAPPVFRTDLSGLSGPAFDIDNGTFARRRIEAVRRNAGPQLAFIEAVARLLDAVKPRIVVVGNDRWWVGQAAVQLARLRGLPTFCLQDGVGSDAVMWRWCSADKMLVNGVQLRDLLLRNGMPEHRLVVTGQPRYDKLPDLALADVARHTRARLALPRNKQLVLFTTQYDQDPGFIGSVVRACLRAPDAHVMLRPHPSQHDRFHEALMRAHPDRVTLCREEPIEQLVAACDVLVAKSSTTTLEAAVLGKPVVIMHDGGTPTFAHTEAIRPIHLNSADELPAVLRGLRDGSRPVDVAAARAAFEYFCGPFDGRSSERVATEFSAALAQRGSRAGDALPPSMT